jgi:hypothetical protein
MNRYMPRLVQGIRTSVSYPKTVRATAWRASVPTTIGTSPRTRSISRVGAIVAACLIEAIMILGFVAAMLGLGSDGQTRVGPDRPSPPEAPAPAPDPRHMWP